jgi:signal peptidase I
MGARMESAPPPLPNPKGALSRLRDRFGLGFVGWLMCGVILALIALGVFGILRPFNVSTNAMAPAIVAGDRVVIEGVTFLKRQPRRGDIVVFKTGGISPSLPSDEYFVKRVAGEPGEHLEISDGKLFINGKQVILSNAMGEIKYELPSLPLHSRKSPPTFATIVPEGCYFVLGDNTIHSLDSRYWGAVPRGNITGRICYCWLPRQRRGAVK